MSILFILITVMLKFRNKYWRDKYLYSCGLCHMERLIEESYYG